MGRADLFHWLPDEEKLLVLLEKVRWVDRPEGISSTKSLLSFSVRVQGRQVCEVTNLEVPSIAEKKKEGRSMVAIEGNSCSVRFRLTSPPAMSNKNSD